MKHRYIAHIPRVYPDVLVPGKGSLTAEHGTIHDFDGAPPNDGHWVPVEDEAPKKVKKDTEDIK